MRKLATLAEGIAGLAVAFVELACTLPKHTLPPEQVLPNVGQTVADTLSAFGVDSLELFCGAGLDATQEDCEIKLTPLFTALEPARNAVTAIGRPSWAVVSWRTDQSGSFRVVETN